MVYKDCFSLFVHLKVGGTTNHICKTHCGEAWFNLPLCLMFQPLSALRAGKAGLSLKASASSSLGSVTRGLKAG